MEKTVITFGDIEIEKQKSHQHKRPISIKNIDINKIVVSNKVSFGKKSFKHFIGYKDTEIRFLCIFLPKLSAYRRDFDETKYVSFLIKDYELGQTWKYVCLPSPGSVFLSTPGRAEKTFFDHFKIEKIALILIYNIFVTKNIFFRNDHQKCFLADTIFVDSVGRRQTNIFLSLVLLRK